MGSFSGFFIFNLTFYPHLNGKPNYYFISIIMTETRSCFITSHLPLHADTLEKEKPQEQESTPTGHLYA